MFVRGVSTRGVGVISRADAIDYGFTGPCLRASGEPYDVRKSAPYLVYDRIDFDIPVGAHGDNFDRYLMRMEEMRQCDRIVRMRDGQIADSGNGSDTAVPQPQAPRQPVAEGAGEGGEEGGVI